MPPLIKTTALLGVLFIFLPVKTLDFNKVIERKSKGSEGSRGRNHKRHKTNTSEEFLVCVLCLLWFSSPLHAACVSTPNVLVDLKLQSHRQAIIQNPACEIDGRQIVVGGRKQNRIPFV